MDDRALLEARLLGQAPTGTVGLRSFDEGVVKTLRAEVVESKEVRSSNGGNYFIKNITGLNLAPGAPGVPVTFFFPEDLNEKFRVPCIVINRDDISPAMNRWMPGSFQYRAPAGGAIPTTVGEAQGFDRTEELQQAVPFDLSYSIVLYTRSRVQGNILLDYVMRIYPPYCNVKVQDSIGDYRLYSAFTESVGSLDDVPEVGERVIVFAITLRVEAELDLNDPVIQKTVTVRPPLRTRGI